MNTILSYKLALLALILNNSAYCMLISHKAFSSQQHQRGYLLTLKNNPETNKMAFYQKHCKEIICQNQKIKTQQDLCGNRVGNYQQEDQMKLYKQCSKTE